ncbi:MAG TPA: hypothetical protein VFE53_07060 [Mucilaginibacter sp.]|jgi:hypothetical protein|nr:hypothetical protein [Mucilaginibacter sp.]
MTAIEHRELKGITIRNLVVTIMGTASIVASVMSTYFGLRSEIEDISISQKTEERINNMRIKVLEDEMFVLQREMDEIKFAKPYPANGKRARSTYSSLLTSTNKPIAR